MFYNNNNNYELNCTCTMYNVYVYVYAELVVRIKRMSVVLEIMINFRQNIRRQFYSSCVS